MKLKPQIKKKKKKKKKKWWRQQNVINSKGLKQGYSDKYCLWKAARFLCQRQKLIQSPEYSQVGLSVVLELEAKENRPVAPCEISY